MNRACILCSCYRKLRFLPKTRIGTGNAILLASRPSPLHPLQSGAGRRETNFKGIRFKPHCPTKQGDRKCNAITTSISATVSPQRSALRFSPSHASPRCWPLCQLLKKRCPPLRSRLRSPRPAMVGEGSSPFSGQPFHPSPPRFVSGV